MEIAIQEQTPPISKEFAVILSEYKMGRKLEESFDDLYKRISRPEVELLNSAISISRAVGGDLADTIESLADTLRERAKVQNKINALTAMGKMQGWVSCLIPGLVALSLFKQEPEAMEVLISEPIGWITLAVISVMMLGAIFVINKIVDIDI
jgi:tight adherence protein B